MGPWLLKEPHGCEGVKFAAVQLVSPCLNPCRQKSVEAHIWTSDD